MDDDGLHIKIFDEEVQQLIKDSNYLEDYNQSVKSFLASYDKIMNSGFKIKFTKDAKQVQIMKELDQIKQGFLKRVLFYISGYENCYEIKSKIYSYFENKNKYIQSPNCEECFSSNLHYDSQLDKLICLNCGLEKTDESAPIRIKETSFKYYLVRSNCFEKMLSDINGLSHAQKQILIYQYKELLKLFNGLDSKGKSVYGVKRKNFFRTPFVIQYLCNKNKFPLFSSNPSDPILQEIINRDIKNPNLRREITEILDKLFSLINK